MKLCLCANCGNYHCNNFSPVLGTEHTITKQITIDDKNDRFSLSTNHKDFSNLKSVNELKSISNRLSFDSPVKLQNIKSMNTSINQTYTPTFSNLPKLIFQKNVLQPYSLKSKFSTISQQIIKTRPFSVFQNQSSKEINKSLVSINKTQKDNQFLPSNFTETRRPISDVFKPPNKLNESLPKSLQKSVPPFQPFPKQKKIPIKLSPSKPSITPKPSISDINKVTNFHNTYDPYNSIRPEIKPHQITSSITKPLQTTQVQEKDIFILKQNSYSKEQDSVLKYVDDQQAENGKHPPPPLLRACIKPEQIKGKIRIQPCTYQDKRCLGINLGSDKRGQVDERGHIKDFLYK